jgi:hypothetical protein
VWAKLIAAHRNQAFILDALMSQASTCRHVHLFDVEQWRRHEAHRWLPKARLALMQDKVEHHDQARAMQQIPAQQAEELLGMRIAFCWSLFII